MQNRILDKMPKTSISAVKGDVIPQTEMWWSRARVEIMALWGDEVNITVSRAMAEQALNPHGGGVKPGCLAISLHDEIGWNSHMALCSSLPLAHQSPPAQPRMCPTCSIKLVNYRTAKPLLKFYICASWRFWRWGHVLICFRVFDRLCLRETLRTGISSSSTGWRAAEWWTTSGLNNPPENAESRAHAMCGAAFVLPKHHGARVLPVAAGIEICLWTVPLHSSMPHVNWCQKQQEHVFELFAFACS